MVRFGMHVLRFSITSYLTRVVDRIALALFYLPREVGLLPKRRKYYGFTVRARGVTLKLLSRVRPTMWVTAERAFAELFFLLLFAIQAPILGPSAFGLVAAVMVFVGFWENVPGQAITEALLSIRQIEGRHFSTVTTTAAVLGLLFGAVVFGFAGPLAVAFGSANLASIMRVMAVLPLIHAFSIAPLAAAQREMRFQSTTLRTIASLLAGGVTGLALALTGAGVWALVWQALVQRLVAAVVLWLAVPVPLSFAVSRRHFREAAAFALPVMLSRVMAWASSQLPRLFLGLYLGTADLGLFSLASRLNTIVNAVAISPKATVARVDLRRFANAPASLAIAVRDMFLHISILGYPACIGGAAIAPTLFHTWLDSRWYGAIVPSQFMLLSCAPYVTFYGSTALLYALNLMKLEAGVTTALSLGGGLAIVAGSPFGLVTTSAAIGVLAAAVVPLPLLVIRRKCGLGVRDILLPQAPAFIASCGMGIAVWLLRLQFEAAGVPNALALCFELAAGAASYGGLLLLLMPERADRLRQYLRTATPNRR
jgi:O-antigen/teichoic acid export membrane protein